jgi:hypothetical protein
MSKKLIFVMISMLGISLALSGVSFAIRLLDRDKAMEEIFGSECKIVSETKDLKGAKLENVKKKLGGKLVDFHEGSKGEGASSPGKIEFLVAVKDGKKVGYAYIDSEPGKRHRQESGSNVLQGAEGKTDSVKELPESVRRQIKQGPDYCRRRCEGRKRSDHFIACGIIRGEESHPAL